MLLKHEKRRHHNVFAQLKAKFTQRVCIHNSKLAAGRRDYSQGMSEVSKWFLTV